MQKSILSWCTKQDKQDKQNTHDIWDVKCDWLCITTNGMLNTKGNAVMGKGIALAAKLKIPSCDKELGKQIKTKGNHVFKIGFLQNKTVFSFPTKHDWRCKSDLKLIEQSCVELLQKWNEEVAKTGKYNIVALPRVGCSNGGLSWTTEVKPLLDQYFEKYWKWFIICN